MKKSTKKIILLGLLAIILLIIPLHFSQAAGAVANAIGNSIIGALSWTVATLLYIVGYVFSGLVFLGGLFFNWTLELNSKIVDNPAVQTGWVITRDIANLGFVFLIIIIAFSTILRMGSFQAKQALPKLIIAAILINFSLLFATMFLDAAGVFMNFFFNSAYSTASGKGGISVAIGQALNLQALLDAPKITLDLSVFGPATMQYIAHMVFLDIMTIVGAVTMFAMAIMFLIRYVYIGLLLILLPAAVLMYAIGSSQWSKWLDKFFKYTFFGPIAGFFIYIALKSTLAFESQAQNYMTDEALNGTIFQGIAGYFASMIMTVFLLLGGLMAAEEMSIMGASAGLKAAKGAATGFLKGIASTGLYQPSKKFGLFKKLGDIGEKYKSSKYGFVRGITRPLRQVEKSTKEFQQNYGGITGIYTATKEGIGKGLGWNSQKFRLKEEKEFEKNIQPKLDKIKAKKAEISPLNKELESINSALKIEEEKPVSTRQDRMGEIKKLKEKKEEINKKIEGINKEISDIENTPPPKKDEVAELKERLEKIEEEKKEEKK